jgi:hypothetical protein
MKKTAILLTALIMGAASASSQCDQNNYVELNANGWEKEHITFRKKEASIEDLINNESTFDPELWYEDFGTFENLGTIQSPRCKSFFKAPARFHTLAKQQPGGTNIIWSEELNSLILPEGWKSGHALETCNKLATHKAMLAEYAKEIEKSYDAMEQEIQKTLQ